MFLDVASFIVPVLLLLDNIEPGEDGLSTDAASSLVAGLVVAIGEPELS